MLNQRSQNDVRITLISRCRRCQPIFNQISTSKRRRMPAGKQAIQGKIESLENNYSWTFVD